LTEDKGLISRNENIRAKESKGRLMKYRKARESNEQKGIVIRNDK
jgi:hypothetical protein